MKKIYTTSLLLFGVLFLVETNAMAQSGNIKLGGGLLYGTGVFNVDEIDNDLGVRVEGIYTINEDFRTGADFTFFFPKSEGDFTATLLAVNLNGNYIFYSEEDLAIYGLAGINIAIVSLDAPEQSFGGVTVGGNSSESEFGLNLGGGIEYALDFGDLFGELKFGGLAGDADQFVIGAGVRFPVN